MDKKIFSIIIIICTAVSVIIMLNSTERRYLETLSVEKVKQKEITKTKEDVYNTYNKKQELKKKNNSNKNNLSMLDKKKILRIANKLSAIDYCRIQKDLKNNNEKNAINTLKKRLTNSEYKEIEKITKKL